MSTPLPLGRIVTVIATRCFAGLQGVVYNRGTLSTRVLVAAVIALLAALGMLIGLWWVTGDKVWAILAFAVWMAPFLALWAFQNPIARQRQRAGSKEAASLGLEYSVEDHFGLFRLPLLIFQGRQIDALFDVLWGKWRNVELKEFVAWTSRQTASGEQVANVVAALGDRPGIETTRDYYSCAVAELARPLPRLVIARGRTEKKLSRRLDLAELEPGVSLAARYEIRAEDPATAKPLLATLTPWLLDPSQKWNFEIVDRWVACYLQAGGSIAAMNALADFVERAGDALPRLERG